MLRVLFTDSPVHTDPLCRSAGLAPGHRGLVHDRRYGPTELMRPCTPYALAESLSASDDAMLADLAPHDVAQTLTGISRAYGGDNTLALAEVFDQLQAIRPSVSGYVNSAAGVASARTGQFSQAVQASQQALLDYHRAARAGKGSQAARDALVAANQDLNLRFQYELEVARRRMSARYRTLSSNEQRLADLVRTTRRVSKLDVASRLESSKLAKLGRGAHYLGNGLTVLDFGSRVHDIYAEHGDGGDWCKKMFVESLSFVLIARFGALASELAAIALGGVVVLTPAGWALIVGGAAAALAVAGATTFGDAKLRGVSEDVYEKIMQFMAVR